ncbi:MAG: tRNA 2-thiouridine(34) synthase MnmA [Candidatus Omnitrophota bacterium]
MMQKTAAVAMSGGVDSSVAAALLKAQGYKVFGITMFFTSIPALRRSGYKRHLRQGLNDARLVARKLGIRHYVFNATKALEEYVIRNFCREYLKGRTPNPCVRCNEHIKFQVLLKEALSSGADFFATGHYARVVKRPNLALAKGEGITRGDYLLKKAKDQGKDQSYFLYRLTQDKLRRLIFPLGGYTKDEVRALADKFKLAVARKRDSQDICFLPQGDYRVFLKDYLRLKIAGGPIVDEDGNVLGQHKGAFLYTVGQREGLGIARGYPVYITRIDAAANKITVGPRQEACKSAFLVKDINYICGPLKKKVALTVKIRYNHPDTPARVEPFDGKVMVKFKRPQFAVTPGQSAVFYNKDIVVGGGIIDEVL